MTKPPAKIALYGPFGWGNLGDAAIQEAMIANLRARLPEAEIVAISLNPENSEAIHGIGALPIDRDWQPSRAPVAEPAPQAATTDAAPAASGWKRRLKAIPGLGQLWLLLYRLSEPLREFGAELGDFRRCRRLLRGIDVLVISGGGQISDDWGGPWDHPWSMLKWMAAARSLRLRVLVLSVGAGPFRRSLSRHLFTLALRLAHHRSTRDVESQRLLARSPSFRGDPMVPDLAFSLPHAASEGGGSTPLRLGVSPLAYCYPKAGPWPEQDRGRYERYLQTLADFVKSALHHGHPVTLFLSQVRNDAYALEDLLKLLPEHLDLQVQRTENLDQLLAQIQEFDVVITARLHGVILSYLHGKPVIALSYDPKIDAVMRHFEQSAHCLPIESASAEAIEERLREIVGNYEVQRSQIVQVATRNAQQLNAQYDRLFGHPHAEPTR